MNLSRDRENLSNEMRAGEDIANAIALGNDSIYVAGVTSGDLDGTGSNQGGDDAWLAKLS